MTLNTPPIKIYVMKEYLTDFAETGYEEGYLVAVNAINGRALFFTVHLSTGALYSKLPIEAILCGKYTELPDVIYRKSTEVLQPFSCLEAPAQVIVYDSLKNYDCKVKIGKEEETANYLFTIDYLGEGLANDPEQYKSHNIVVLENCQLAALPNNHILFIDKFFTNKDVVWPKYRRQSKHYFSE